MNETKPAIASTTTWGVMLIGLSTALSIAGIKVEGLDDPQLALDISTLIGAAMALYGRFRPMIKPISGLFRSK